MSGCGKANQISAGADLSAPASVPFFLLSSAKSLLKQNQVQRALLEHASAALARKKGTDLFLGSDEVGGNVRSALQPIDKNEKFIKMNLAILMASE
ncbi:hypothetical protein HNR03_004951 [Pseudomonas sp. JAI111]|nr:hypothetical protein [Pseudomonas sp. JAI111]